jgi:DNA-binding HxlR family transcriptional regulator
MKAIVHRSECPLSFSLDFFGDKWTLLILRDIMLYDKGSFIEFLASDEKIATNILTDRLNMLHSEGFLVKSVSPQNKSKFVYTLTEKGIALVPMLIELLVWGSQFNGGGGPPEVVNKLKKGKNKYIKELQEKLESKRLAVADILKKEAYGIPS